MRLVLSQKTFDPMQTLARKRAHAAVCIALLATNFAFAQVIAPNAPIADPALEARVKTLASELRCLVCQNQTVADSDAPVARDMREQVRAQLASGKSEVEVKAYMTERFGDFVLYKPPLKASTLVLWVAPFAALLLGLGVLVWRLKSTSRQGGDAQATISEAERERARRMLEDAP